MTDDGSRLHLTPASLIDATRMMIAGGCSRGQVARGIAKTRLEPITEPSVAESIETMVVSFTTEPPRVPEVYTAQLIRYASEHSAAVVALAAADVLGTWLAPPTVAEFLAMCETKAKELTATARYLTIAHDVREQAEAVEREASS